MNEKIFTHKRIRLFAGLALLIMFVLILTYALRVQLTGNSQELANFSTFFSGIVTPLFTFVSVGALVWTLKIQHDQFKHHQKEFFANQRSSQFQKHVERFESQLEKFYIQAAEPLTIHDSPNPLIFKDVIFLNNESDEYQRFIDFTIRIDSFKKIENTEDVPSQYQKELFFVYRLIGKCNAACITLRRSFDFYDKEDIVLVHDLVAQCTFMIHELTNMGLINLTEKEKLLDLIKPKRVIR